MHGASAGPPDGRGDPLTVAVRSSHPDLVVRGGTVVGVDGRIRADLLVRGESIIGVHEGMWDGRAATEIDASGLLVLPGMIDSHVHLMDPGDPERETFVHGTAAAAAAGVTTIVEHTHGWPVHELARLKEKRRHLRGRAHVDFGLAAHVWPDRLSQLRDLWGAGVTFFKIFTCTTHGVPGLGPDALVDTMSRLAALNAPALVHCEDEGLTAAAERVLRDAGRRDPALLLEWRTREAELLAVTQVAATALLTGAAVRVAHASHADVVDIVRTARRDGARISAETCPQYLLLREDEIHELGALRKFTPPARARCDDDLTSMWQAVNDGSIDHLASDHAPATRAQKVERSFWDAPFGLPGLDTTFPLLLDAALRGATTLEQVARVYAWNPARFFRLDRKGALMAGMDADFTLVDPTSTWTVANSLVRSKAGWSPFAGRSLQGRVVATVVRGRTVFHAGRLAEERHGRFLPGPGVAR